MAGMSERFRARTFDVPPLQIIGTVEQPIEAQAREVTTGRDSRHIAYCISIAIPAVCAIGAVIAGDIRVALILFLVALAITLAGLLMLDGPA